MNTVHINHPPNIEDVPETVVVFQVDFPINIPNDEGTPTVVNARVMYTYADEILLFRLQDGALLFRYNLLTETLEKPPTFNQLLFDRAFSTCGLLTTIRSITGMAEVQTADVGNTVDPTSGVLVTGPREDSYKVVKLQAELSTFRGLYKQSLEKLQVASADKARRSKEVVELRHVVTELKNENAKLKAERMDCGIESIPSSRFELDL